MYLNILIILLSLYIYTTTPIRFSNKHILYNINYNKLYNSIIYFIIIIELIHLLEYERFNLYILIITAFLSYIILDIIKQPSTIDDGSFNPPPKYISTSYIPYLILLIALINKIVITKNYYYLVLIIIYTLLLFRLFNYSACKYDLPITWNRL